MMDMEQELTGRHYMDGWSDGKAWAQGEPVAPSVSTMLLNALKHLEHNARKSGAEMGYALGIAQQAIAMAEAKPAAPKAAPPVAQGEPLMANGLTRAETDATASVAGLAAQGEPVAWYVERVAPGKRDHGMRLGPWWKREQAEEWADDRHVLRELLAAAPKAAPPVAQAEELLLATRSAMTCSHRQGDRVSVYGPAWERLTQAVAILAYGITAPQGTWAAGPSSTACDDQHQIEGGAA